MKMGIKEMCELAELEIETITAADALKVYQDDDVIIVDIRDIRELYRDGKIPGAYHAPRGMLEFWVDTESPYHKPIFASGKRFRVSLCWRPTFRTIHTNITTHGLRKCLSYRRWIRRMAQSRLSNRSG